jgi:hypothetical protein
MKANEIINLNNKDKQLFPTKSLLNKNERNMLGKIFTPVWSGESTKKKNRLSSFLFKSSFTIICELNGLRNFILFLAELKHHSKFITRWLNGSLKGVRVITNFHDFYSTFWSFSVWVGRGDFEERLRLSTEQFIIIIIFLTKKVPQNRELNISIGGEAKKDEILYWYDEDEIRTHACRAHWISSPTP